MKKNNLKWAIKTFIFSIFMSLMFSMFSQSLFSNLSVILSVFIILFFVFLSVIFDMVGVAVTTLNKESLDKYKNQSGYLSAKRLCDNREKISSFCGDVVGDICSILSGAGGVSLILFAGITDAGLEFFMTCLISSLIAGLTIFGKAVMKVMAVNNCEVIALRVGKMLEFSPFKSRKKKNDKKKQKP